MSPLARRVVWGCVLAAVVVGGAGAIALALGLPTVPDSDGFRLAYVHLGLDLARRKDPGAAAEAFRKAIDLAPRIAGPHRELGVALVALGRTDEAATEFETALRLEPRYAAAHEDLAGLLMAHGNLDDAERHLLEAYRIDPQRISAIVGLGDVAMSRHRDQEAADWYRKALALDPNLPSVRTRHDEALREGGPR
jgi:Flp pilus assembly protein TadD